MSIFKTKWIILKKIYKNKDLIYIIFSENYWKITVFSKNSNKEKKLDLWYLISFEIKTNQNNDILKINNIKILNEFNYLRYNFEIIYFYQILISLILKLIPEKKQIFQIIEIIEKINFLSHNLENEKIFEKILFAWLKIINILWLLKIENKNTEIKKILNFIDKNNFYTIVKLYWVWEKNKKILEKIIKEKIDIN